MNQNSSNFESPTIVQLPQDVINRISAGEVIHQPYNVVKELFENALDANATQITVSLENGGFSKIQISDNGSGIAQRDIASVCLRHTTSKLTKFSDLSKLTTFGFRGEALFSMSCVSHLSIITKTEEMDFALKVNYSNGKPLDNPEPAASTNGTIVEVCDLFYNKPEKIRAIPDVNSQNRQVLQITTQYAIAFPQTSIVTIIEGKEKLHTFGGTTTESVLALIYGIPANSTAVFTIEADIGHNVTAKLFLGTVAASRKMKGATIFINDRLVRCEKVKKSLETVYSEFLMKGDKPFFVAMLYVPPKDVDVNVHPTKRDVTFSNSELLTEKLCNVVRERLAEKISGRPFKKKIAHSNQSTIECSLSKSRKGNQQLSELPIKGLVQSDLITKRSSPFNNNENEEENGRNENNEEDSNSPVIQQQQIQRDLNNESLSYESQIDTQPPDLFEINHQNNQNFNNNNENENDMNDSIDNSEDSEPSPKRKFGLNSQPLSSKQSKLFETTPIKQPPKLNSSQLSVSSSRAAKKKSISIFDDLRYEPFASKLTRGDPMERTIEQVLSLASSHENHEAEYREIDLESVNSLREKEAQESSPALCALFRKLIFVGTINLTYVLFSSDDTLYKCELFPLTRMFFYQLILRHFGNYGEISFETPIEIDKILNVLPNKPDVDVLSIMNEHSEMLNEYFNIGISGNGLYKMPNILPGYEPSFTTIGLFFIRLAKNVCWEFEYDCISAIVNELAYLYAIQPEDEVDPDYMTKAKNVIQNVVMPEMKTEAFQPKSDLVVDRSLIRIKNNSEMYKIFERT